jgi:tryptophan 2,3-dioxygenase
MINLVALHEREAMQEYSDLGTQLDKLYWRSGATELASGKKTLTLRQFEEKYMKQFLEMGMKYRDRNLRKLYLKHFSGSPEVISRLREFDSLSNVLWPLSHLKSAGRYLRRPDSDIKATGGTNWQKYLPPRFQKIMFFPELWSGEEQEEWGKAAVLHAQEAMGAGH